MAEISVGACSWTDPALVASGWYPAGKRDAEGRLRHYATRFPVVEVDSTYYALPSTRNSGLWVQRTPPGFTFDVKAFSLLTGHPTRTAALPADLRRGGGTWARPDDALRKEVWERFSGALEPLREGGRLGTLLFQFPPSLAPGARAEEVIGECAARTAGWPVAVEFRHPGWWQEERRTLTAELLARYGMTAVAVDTVQGLPASVPPVAVVTAPELAVVRFHGRNPAWGSSGPGSKEEKYRHAYTEAELAPWVPRVREMASRAASVHVLFNNCCADASVRAAETMLRMLGGGGGGGGSEGGDGTRTRTEGAGPGLSCVGASRDGEGGIRQTASPVRRAGG
ncbi:DUF72 domain-containing protein [Streptomyces sp. CB00455]|uniref:DUF72 domain-containing protein n=1 Tax=Streptomyces sp. CB00455 TaxID=1703927 RepID=UPI0009A0C594|nr:DUF72 domain-containing protein [Streptomyces sp. CB00455]